MLNYLFDINRVWAVGHNFVSSFPIRMFQFEESIFYEPESLYLVYEIFKPTFLEVTTSQMQMNSCAFDFPCSKTKYIIQIKIYIICL